MLYYICNVIEHIHVCQVYYVVLFMLGLRVNTSVAATKKLDYWPIA